MKVHDSRGSRATEALPSEDADSSFCKTQHQAEVASVATEDAETVNPVVASNLIEEAVQQRAATTDELSFHGGISAYPTINPAHGERTIRYFKNTHETVHQRER
ncbi:hypothetical protein L914_18981 [Phytophthora nicotianae]|uniref:Uncharacterized protein n=2 Tax=Phytophthora nicotianae TaxID=4792 RepID=V9E3E1_PHYNI|nr:hypothetical protein F443_19748 [Phytophthora nicotianae P1569]ETM33820.1 hypothetical protein L914_18981 [Phytophthora nicotianae]